MVDDKQFDTLLQEKRVFKPSRDFSKQAHIQSMAQYREMYEESVKRPAKFWTKVANNFHWFKKWNKVLEWTEPHAKWFVGGETNISYNCLDRHLTTWRKNKAALIWEGEPGDSRTLTYQELHREVCKFANAMKSVGIRKGDRVIIYMPQTPEAAIAMLACARIGAPHSVVFAGFSANSLRDRIDDCRAKAVLTADGGFRAREHRTAQEKRGRGGRRRQVDQVDGRLAPHGQRRQDEKRARPLVSRSDGKRLARLPRRQARFRTPSLHPLHERHDG